MFNQLKSKKGFTLIELIIVMVIIGILLLLATPKFLDHVETAKLIQIKNDTKVAENMMMAKMANNELDFNTLSPTDKKEGLNKASKDMNDTEALKGNTYDITSSVNSKLSGRFILNEDGKVVYYDKNQNTEWLAKDEDFEFIANSYGYEVKGKGIGYFKYTGDKKIVEIPNSIQGHPMTSYYRMFFKKNVEKIISSNKEVTNMKEMFYYSQSTTLDLSSFDTSNVTNMEDMFSYSKVTTLDLSNFNTSNVKDMSRMFLASKATTLDLSSFDTSNVTDMSGMFYHTQVKPLDLSSFNTSSVTDMSNMFDNTQATTIVFGDNFNTTKVTNMYSMFAFSQVTTLDLSKFDTSNVTNMSNMFYSSQVTELDLSNFDTAKVFNMDNMFRYSKATTGWAKTQKDADKFNDQRVTDIPDTLRFKIKSS